MKKSITIRDEFIKLGQALKLSGEADTGVDAKLIIEAGKVKVNGETEERRGRKLYNGDTFTVNNSEIEVISKQATVK
ncbi:MAG: RNA-binding S4 domain-containing protein [Lachnospiraceae bacterium]|nr:RNA-binding S4 domain-containing protein [Lachnospiraceae bacterium]